MGFEGMNILRTIAHGVIQHRPTRIEATHTDLSIETGSTGKLDEGCRDTLQELAIFTQKIYPAHEILHEPFQRTP